MSLPLRITFEGKDYQYTILTRPVTKDTSVVRILLDGEEYELLPKEKDPQKSTSAAIGDNARLLHTIARSIALRWKL